MQALVQEEAIRHWATTTAYRMDLAAARSGDPNRIATERSRFDRAMAPFLAHKGPKVWGGCGGGGHMGGVWEGTLPCGKKHAW